MQYTKICFFSVGYLFNFFFFLNHFLNGGFEVFGRYTMRITVLMYCKQQYWVFLVLVPVKDVWRAHVLYTYRHRVGGGGGAGES